MKIIITGASGLVGRSLSQSLRAGGHTVEPLLRGKHWDITAGKIDSAILESTDVLIHLAGENIASGRWSDEQKKRIRDSRVNGTRLLSEALAALNHKPKLLIAASAVGYYGDRGDEKLDESSTPGNNFLAKICVEWEQATAPAASAGIRVIHMRLGVVLDPAGGALKKMLLPFKLGGGGVMGSGKQFMPWITLQDIVGIVRHMIDDQSMVGPVNTVTPDPPTNYQYTKALGAALHRPTIFPMPAFMARLAFGQMADELLLSSARVAPAKLLAAGYKFHDPEIKTALSRLLSR